MQDIQPAPDEVDGEFSARVLSDEPDEFPGITFDRGALLVDHRPAEAVHDRITLPVHHVFPIRVQRVIYVGKSVRLTASSGAELVEVPLSDRLLFGVLGEQHPKVSVGREAVLVCVSYCARRANQKYFIEHSVYLFSRCALIAANSGDKVVACLRAEAPSCARQDIPEVAAVRAIGVNRSQLGCAVAIEMASQVDDTGQGRRGNARPAEHPPATESLALRAVVDGDTALWIGVEREIRGPSGALLKYLLPPTGSQVSVRIYWGRLRCRSTQFR